MVLELIKQNEKGRTYQSDGFKISYRNKGATTENAENPHEILYYILGKVEVTVGDKTEIVESPAKIEIPSNTYHKIVALTDIACILFEDKN